MRISITEADLQRMFDNCKCKTEFKGDPPEAVRKLSDYVFFQAITRMLEDRGIDVAHSDLEFAYDEEHKTYVLTSHLR
jgi:hypothetical protein